MEQDKILRIRQPKVRPKLLSSSENDPKINVFPPTWRSALETSLLALPRSVHLVVNPVGKSQGGKQSQPRFNIPWREMLALDSKPAQASSRFQSKLSLKKKLLLIVKLSLGNMTFPDRHSEVDKRRRGQSQKEASFLYAAFFLRQLRYSCRFVNKL